ncbi:DEAD/DEAH box helicase family protein [bacterium]|nr:DEAD/DEAH box helicase family protein [bacterium]
MRVHPIKIITESNSWQQFVGNLSNLGNSSEFKKTKGDAFEFLSKFFLLTDPTFLSMFDSVLHHSEMSFTLREELKLPNPEVGVDLVAKYKDGTFCAIQSKFHQDRLKNVTYDELSTFFSVTERKETYSKLSHRIICTSANEISRRVSKLHSEKLGFLTYSDFDALDEARFSQIHQIIKGNKINIRPYSPRKHQIRAINKANEYFIERKFDRGKIIHPCGSGKSLTAYWIAKNLKIKTVLLAVPSLALVRQTLNAWSRQAIADGSSIDYIAVCSDKDVEQSDDPSLNTHELGISVTTDPNRVKQFLNTESSNMRVVLTTYQSGEVVISASQMSDHVFDLGVFDEAHKTTGDKSKRFALLLDDQNVCIEKKVFMTATERQFAGDTTNLFSMDDQSIYGSVIDQVSFRDALDQFPPILCDYRIITIAVSRSDIEKLIVENQLARANSAKYTFIEDGATIAALIAIRKLSEERGIKHAISFHKSIKRANEFLEMNNSLNLFSEGGKFLKAFHVSGKMSTSSRSLEINRFIENTPSVISNARCLTEGVDIPMVDAVVFADPKQSMVDIVQAAGRAMRYHPKKSIGYIIIPVLVDSEGSDKVNEAFKQLVNVIAALGMNDDRIIDEAKQFVKSRIITNTEILEFEDFTPEVEIKFEQMVKEIKLKIWDRLSFAKSVVGETEFKKWMQNKTELSEASMEKYTRVIRKISNDLVKLNLAYSTLEEITEKADLASLKEQYFSIDEYRDLDQRGNRMYSAGFNRLIDYQNSRKSHVIN